MRFVPVKTAEQQAALMMVGLRDRLIRNCTQLSNAIRGYAAEFGFSAAKGKVHLVPLLERIQADESCPSSLESCSRPKLKNMRGCRRKSTQSTSSSWPGTKPMKAVGALLRSPASVRSAQFC